MRIGQFVVFGMCGGLPQKTKNFEDRSALEWSPRNEIQEVPFMTVS